MVLEFQKKEIQRVIIQEIYLFNRHKQFQEKSKKEFLEWMDCKLFEPLNLRWANLRRSRNHLTLFRCFRPLRFPLNRNSLKQTKMALQKRYDCIENIDTFFQSVFIINRELRDSYVFVWIYQKLILRLAGVFFAFYIYESILPKVLLNTLTLFKAFLMYFLMYLGFLSDFQFITSYLRLLFPVVPVYFIIKNCYKISQKTELHFKEKLMPILWILYYAFIAFIVLFLLIFYTKFFVLLQLLIFAFNLNNVEGF